MHHDILTVHALYSFFFCSIFFGANLQSALGFYCFSLGVLLCLCPFLSIMPRKTRARRFVPTPIPSPPSFDREKFPSEKNQEIFEKLNLRRKIWSERSVILDELDHAIRANLKRRGWLPLWIFLILLHLLPWFESSTWTSRSASMIPTL